MNSIWNNNLKAFKNRFPQLAQMYTELTDYFSANCEDFSKTATFWKTEAAKNGEPTATENGLRLHSGYNPSREAEGSLKNSEISDKANLVFYGFGLGYQIIKAAELFSEKKFIIIEPDPLHFFAALLFLDWQKVFSLEKLVIAVGCPAESILQLIESSDKINIGKTGVSDSYFFKNPAFINHNQQYFETVNEIVLRNIQKNKINEATLKKFGKLWIKNSLSNISKLKTLEGIECYKNQASKNMPFLIVGAGPSLEEIIPYLQKIKNRCVIVCVETALHTLLKVNIQPDFVILLDPQYWAFKHILGLNSPESILITEVCAYPSVFRFNCKEIKLCSSQFPVGKYFEESLSYFPGDLGTGGSVAASAWNFAYYCGAKEIYLAGLDLGFPNKQTHIKGSSAEQTFHKISNRVSTAEKSGIANLFSANVQIDKNYHNQEIITDSRMKMFAWWFESRLANCMDQKTFTLCPAGLKIPGVEISSVEKLLTKPEISEQKNEFLLKSKKPDLDSKAFDNLLNAFPHKTDFFTINPFLKEFF